MRNPRSYVLSVKVAYREPRADRRPLGSYPETPFSFRLPGLIPPPFRRTAFSRFHLRFRRTPRNFSERSASNVLAATDTVGGMCGRAADREGCALQAAFSRTPNPPAFSWWSFS